jgi:hypothetical protein
LPEVILFLVHGIHELVAKNTIIIEARRAPTIHHGNHIAAVGDEELAEVILQASLMRLIHDVAMPRCWK